MAPPDFRSTFAALRAVLERHRGAWRVEEDSAHRYSLAGATGPTTLRSWGGRLKQTTIPLAWVVIGKAYVSYHLIGIYGNARLIEGMSKDLKARMQGKTCFNFRNVDPVLFQELDDLTARAIAGFRKAGFVCEP